MVRPGYLVRCYSRFRYLLEAAAYRLRVGRTQVGTGGIGPGALLGQELVTEPLASVALY